MSHDAIAKLAAPVSHFLSNTLVRNARNGLWAVLLAALAYYALFRLPFRLPPQQQLVSPSYAFGFNNSVAILAMAGLLSVTTLLYLLPRRRATELPIVFPRERAIGIQKSTIIAFALVALFYAGLTYGMYI